MWTRATRRIFWWYLSCAVLTLDLVETAAVVPVFPGEIAYFLVDVPQAPSDMSEEEDQMESDDERVREPQNLSSHKKCSIILIIIRTFTLVVAITFLLLHRRLCDHASGLYNQTREVAD